MTMSCLWFVAAICGWNCYFRFRSTNVCQSVAVPSKPLPFTLFFYPFCPSVTQLTKVWPSLFFLGFLVFLSRVSDSVPCRVAMCTSRLSKHSSMKIIYAPSFLAYCKEHTLGHLSIPMLLDLLGLSIHHILTSA